MRDPLSFDRVVALDAVVLVLLAIPGCGRRETRPADDAGKPVEVTAVTVAAQDVPVSNEFVAQTQSSRQVNIQARVSGFLERRVHTEGSIVAAAAVEEAKARLETAQLNLSYCTIISPVTGTTGAAMQQDGS